MTGKFTIPGRLPGLNDYIAAERTHRQKAAKMKKECEQNVLRCIGNTQGVTFDHVRMVYRWYEKDKRRDKDNVSAFGRKVIQDAIVRSGLLPNDGWNNIDGFEDWFFVDKDDPRIEVELYGVEKP